MLDLKLKTFLKLYETMNYHETAHALNLTQPAVTQQIKALETEYGCRLFSYDHKSLKATPAAAILETYARSAVYNDSRLAEQLQQPPLCTVRIGATKTIGEYLISDLTVRFLQDPSLTATIVIDNTARLLAQLDRHQLDFALIEGFFQKSRYASQRFRTEALTGICAPGHPLQGQTVPLEHLLPETLILREQGSGTRELFTNLLATQGYSTADFPRVVTVNEFSLLTALVAQGCGISFVYEAVAAHDQRLARFAIQGIQTTHELNYVYLKDTSAFQWVRRFAAGA
ncbi:MAG: LysR family transcriptional regulator [Oscillospiraceae bacterium]|nr:LysR family transcriptional regulator [Oscillospiraceae bacterium]MDD4369423.1 LysR family transcriptional regulator [Oscillospiraceae bacterium]